MCALPSSSFRPASRQGWRLPLAVACLLMISGCTTERGGPPAPASQAAGGSAGLVGSAVVSTAAGHGTMAAQGETGEVPRGPAPRLVMMPDGSLTACQLQSGSRRPRCMRDLTTRAWLEPDAGCTDLAGIAFCPLADDVDYEAVSVVPDRELCALRAIVCCYLDLQVGAAGASGETGLNCSAWRSDCARERFEEDHDRCMKAHAATASVERDAGLPSE